MSKVKSLLAIMMAMLLCIGIFAGCSTTTTNNNSGSDNDSDTTQNNQSDTSGDDTLTDEVEDVIGEVTYVGTSMMKVLPISPYITQKKISLLDPTKNALSHLGECIFLYPARKCLHFFHKSSVFYSVSVKHSVLPCMRGSARYPSP